MCKKKCKESVIAKLVIGHHAEYDQEKKTYLAKTGKRYAWIYQLKEAVVIGDVLLVQTCKGNAYIKVEKIINIVGKNMINKYKKAVANMTAWAEIKQN